MPLLEIKLLLLDGAPAEKEAPADVNDPAGVEDTYSS